MVISPTPPPPARRPTGAIAAILLLSLLILPSDLGDGDASSRPLAALQSQYTSDNTLLTAHLILSSGDCLAYLGYLTMLNHEELHDFIGFGSVVLLDGRAKGIRDELSRIGLAGVDVRPPSTELLQLLRRLSVKRTPLLLVLKRNGDLIFAESLPTTARGRTYLAQSLVAIARLARSDAGEE
jgi:hypothetical protein